MLMRMRMKITLSGAVMTMINMTMIEMTIMTMLLMMRMKITLPGTDSGGTNKESQAITTNTGDCYDYC